MSGAPSLSFRQPYSVPWHRLATRMDGEFPHLLEATGISDRVYSRVIKGMLVVPVASAARQGWAEAFAAVASAGDDALLDPETSTVFDEDEWTWPNIIVAASPLL